MGTNRRSEQSRCPLHWGLLDPRQFALAAKATVAMRKAATIGMVAAALVLTGCEKFALDRQMEELCKKDGGVKVYETVALPTSMFDRLGDPFPGWPSRPQEERFGPEYRYVVEIVYLKQGDPVEGEGRLERATERIYRRSDGKLMGEAITYVRSGGDFIAYAHPTSNRCPIYRSSNEMLIRSVFVKKGE